MEARHRIFYMEVDEMKVTQKTILSRSLGILLILALVIAMIPAIPGEAASTKSKALAAYKKMLSQSTVTVVPKKVPRRWGSRTYNPAKAKNVFFSIAYIDNDSVPELILFDQATDYYGIWTYRNGKIVNLEYLINYQEPGYYNRIYGYYLKKGIFLTYHVFPDDGHDMSYYKISNGKAKEVLCRLKDKGDKSERYYCTRSNGTYKQLAKRTFYNKLKSYIGSTKFRRLCVHRNTASNRKKFVK